MRMLVVDILKAARDKISQPEAWIKEKMWDTKYTETGVVRCYCTLGAVCAATQEAMCNEPLSRAFDMEDYIIEALRKAIPSYPTFTSISRFNDDPRTTHKDVLALFNRAIVAQSTLL
jgi:hypothetical protein